MTPKAPKGNAALPAKGFRPEGPKPRKWMAVAGMAKHSPGTDSLNEKTKGTARGCLDKC
jgi:hypothetical protein